MQVTLHPSQVDAHTLTDWVQYSTVGTGVATVVYVCLTGALVWVAWKQKKAMARQTALLERQADIADTQASIASSQVRLQAEQGIPATIRDLAGAALDLQELWIRANGIAPLMIDGASLQGNPKVLEFFELYERFYYRWVPLLQAHSASAAEYGGLEHLSMVVRDSLQKQVWVYVSNLQTNFGGAANVLLRTKSAVHTEQSRQAALLTDSRRLANSS